MNFTSKIGLAVLILPFSGLGWAGCVYSSSGCPTLKGGHESMYACGVGTSVTLPPANYSPVSTCEATPLLDNRALEIDIVPIPADPNNPPYPYTTIGCDPYSPSPGTGKWQQVNARTWQCVANGS